VSASAGLTRRLTLDRAVLLAPVLGLHRRGAGDPTHRMLGPDHHLRATRTPAGPALLRVAAAGAEVVARAWGEGADWVLDQLPRLVGEDDDVSGFTPAHPLLVEAQRRYGNFRVGRSDAVHEALAPACLEQVVTGKEAFRAWRLLVTQFGELAPGPTAEPGSAAFGMRVPPRPEVWARVPSWTFLAAGVEERRSRTLVQTAGRAVALERTLALPHADADRALRSLPGVGPWTSAEVRQRAHGDADAWSVGDFHVGKNITWALTGEVLDDGAATELLEPYRGHRFRVQALLGLLGGATRRPRRAPRMALPTHTPYATRGRS